MATVTMTPAELAEFEAYQKAQKANAAEVVTKAAETKKKATKPQATKAQPTETKGYTRKVNPRSKKVSYECEGQVSNDGALTIVAPQVHDRMYHESGRMSQVTHLEIVFDGGIVYATVCWS